MPENIELVFAGIDLIDLAEPIWLSLYDHHLAIGGAGLPMIDRDRSWPLRRAYYESLLVKPDAFMLLAQRDQMTVGYALAHIHEGADDTWPTGHRIGEIASLAVMPPERGSGLGTRLLDTAEARLASVGARSVMILAMTGNEDALRFYQRRGMTPVSTVLMRLPEQRPKSQS